MSGPLAAFQAWRRARLTRRIALPVITATLLFLGALGFVAFRIGQRAVVDQVEARNRQLAVQVSGEIATFFQAQLDTLRLQSDRLLNSTAPDEQSAALVRLRAQFPYIFNDLRLYDGSGRVQLSAAGPLSEVLARGAQYAAAPADAAVAHALASRTIVVSPVAFRPLAGTPYITTTLPLLRCEGAAPCEAAGAIQAQIDLRSFWTKVDGFRIEDGAVTIVDNRGVIVAHPDRRQVGAQIDQEALAGVFRGLEGTTSYRRGGATYLAAYAPVGPPLGWGVIVEQERDAALGPVGRIGLAASLATLLSALSLGLLLSTLIGRALAPVNQLSQTAAQIAASGDLQAVPTIDVPGHAPSGELAALTASFNQMIERLRLAQAEQQAWNEALEERVAERTAQLQTVLEVARLSAGTLEERAVLQTLLEQVGRLVEFDAATIRLISPTGDKLETVAVSGQGARNLPRSAGLARGILSEVMRERQPRIVADTAASQSWQESFGPDPTQGSWLGVPLLVHDEPIGTLSVYHRSPGVYGEEQAALLMALGGQVAITLAHARLYEESVRRVEQELQTARQIQRHLFPERAPTLSGLDIATFYRPARETTGDFYSFVTPARRNQGEAGPDAVDLFIGDVSGKSLPAALLMTMARTTLYAAASGGDGGPVATLQQANRVLVGDMPRGSFVASTFARLDRTAGTCTLVNAAQPAPLLVRGGAAELLEGPGAHLPLGVVADPEYEALTVPLRSGDLLLFYTDGVIEAFSPEGELFGFERLAEVGVACGDCTAHEAVDRLMAAVADWMGPRPQHDDIAILVVRITEGWG